MSHTSLFRSGAGVVTGLLIFVLFGLFLFVYSHNVKAFSSDQIVWDLQWLNAWSILFYLILLTVWASKLTQRLKAAISLCCFSIWGFVAVGLMLDGTPFGWNAYWGDQQFRTAMMLKFMSFSLPTDFYYKELPPFYPPFYFYLLSLYARLFSLEAYQMLKTGTFLIYLFGPALLFYFWGRLVSHFQAFCITLATFLFQPAVVFTVPHEFLSGIFFFPWWLYFVEQLKARRQSRTFVLVGGLIGAAIFMTYYYAFFLGGILLIVKTILALSESDERREKLLQCKRMWLMTGVVALFAAPYWAPLLLSILGEGYSAGQNQWFRIGYAGVDFPFLEFTFAGLLTFGGLIYALRRHHTSVNRGLLLLVGTVPLFLIVGYVLGNLDFPVLYVKAFEFLKYQAGTFIGLAVAGVLRLGMMRKRIRYATGIGVSVLILVFLSSFTSLIHDRAVETARHARPDACFADSQLQADTHGKVFLTSEATLPVFLSSHMFVAPNEHYSHPAGRFNDRLDFLELLQSAEDPFLFWVALRYNIYDPVDYVMSKAGGEHVEIPVNRSNYPNGFVTQVFKYKSRLLADSVFFACEKAIGMYRVRESVGVKPMQHYSRDSMTTADSLRTLRWGQDIAWHLDSLGVAVLTDYLNVSDLDHNDRTRRATLHDFGGYITLMSAAVVENADSTTFSLQFEIREEVDADFKVFLHICDPEDHSQFDNFDFRPNRPTSTWKRGERVRCVQSIPKREGSFDYHLGFFIGEHRLGDGFWGEYSVGD